MPFNYLDISRKSKRSQSALEYMMTYGWAILIIVIVAVILYSMGIFNPSSSVTFTSSGFSPFTVSSSLCNNIGYKIAVLAGPIPNNANSLTINKVYLTSATGANTTTASYTLTNPVTLKSGQSATILIPNVACNSANTHYSLSAKIQYSYDVPTIGTQTINTTGTVAGTSITGKPSNLTSYEPITITNTQSSATPNPFQQMINFTSSDNGWTSISTDFGQNVEFFYYNGTVIPSWLQNYTSGYALWWLKIAAIPGGSSETVYVGFAPRSVNLFNNINDGEAPELSGTGPSVLPSNIIYSIPYAIVYGYGTDYDPFTFNLTINPSLLSQYEASNLSNLEVFAANGTELQAKLQGTPTSLSTSAVISITFPGGMNYFTDLHANSPYGSNSYNLFYLGFASPSTDLHALDDNNIPYSSYPAILPGNGPLVKDIGKWGEYDDGADVFNNYTNFSGEKIRFANPWSFGLSAQGFGLFTGLDYTPGNRMGYSIMPISYGEIGQSYTKLNNWDFTASPAYITNTTYTSLYGPFNLVPGQCCALPSNQGEATDLGWGTNGSGIEPMANFNLSGEYIFKQNQSAFTKINSSVYGVVPINSSYEEFLLGNKIIGVMHVKIKGRMNFGISTVNAGQDLYSYWMLVRAYPPNGVMPSVSFGT